MKKSQRRQLSTRNLSLIFLFLIPALTGLIGWQITKSKQAFDVTINDVAFLGGGQLCPDPLYDSQGNSYPEMVWGNIDYITYSGPAPLYSVDPSNYPANPGSDPCWYPEKISHDIAINGRKIYPLLLTVNNTNNMKKGESTKLSAEVQLLDQYPGGPPEDAVLFATVAEPTATLHVYFSLDSTSFEFAPPNEPVSISSLSFLQPTHQDWIISPDENALGEQFFSVRLYDNDAKYTLASADITINVEDISGLNPTLVALLSAAGTFILGLLMILNRIQETWTAYKAKPQKKSKPKNKK